MAMQLNRKLIINIVGLVIALIAAYAGYSKYMKPRIQYWLEGQKEIAQREEKLERLRTDFGGQNDPTVELKILEEEIETLTQTNLALEKIRKMGLETDGLPKELEDPDPEIQIELYRDYISQVMDVQEENLKKDLKSALISPPDINLHADLSTAAEAAYYINRAGGLRGIVDAMAKTQSGGNNIIFDELTLENYDRGSNRRSATGNVLSYQLKMTLSAQSLMALIYNLQEAEGYYYFEDMTLEPAKGGRFDVKEQQLSVESTINTVLVYKSEAERRIQMAADITVKASKGGPLTGVMGMMIAMQKKVDRELKAREEKKWYQFWK
jgi:hypothetical protein